MSYQFRQVLTTSSELDLDLSLADINGSSAPRGVSIAVGKSENFLNVNLPGSGLSYRVRLGSASLHRQTPYIIENDEKSSKGSGFPNNVACWLSKTFVLDLRNGDTGRVLGVRQREAFLKNNGTEMEEQLWRAAHEINEALMHAGAPHLSIEVIDPFATIIEREPLQRPNMITASDPLPKRSSAALRKGESLPVKLRAYRRSLRDWLEIREIESKSVSEKWGPYSELKALERLQMRKLKRQLATDEQFFAECLKKCLGAVSWPRDTLCIGEISERGSVVSISFNLPDLDDLPDEMVKVVSEEFRMEGQMLTSEERMTLWRRCIFSIVAAFIRLVFSLNPHTQRIIIQGYRGFFDDSELFRSSPVLVVDITQEDYQWDRRVIFDHDDLENMCQKTWCILE